jgi:hypothetical protein
MKHYLIFSFSITFLIQISTSTSYKILDLSPNDYLEKSNIAFIGNLVKDSIIDSLFSETKKDSLIYKTHQLTYKIDTILKNNSKIESLATKMELNVFYGTWYKMNKTDDYSRIPFSNQKLILFVEEDLRPNKNKNDSHTNEYIYNILHFIENPEYYDFINGKIVGPILPTLEEIEKLKLDE